MERRNPFSDSEADYIRRVAGKVPVEVIARTIKRSIAGVQRWAFRHAVKLRVPHSVMIKNWQDVIEERRSRNAPAGQHNPPCM